MLKAVLKKEFYKSTGMCVPFTLKDEQDNFSIFPIPLAKASEKSKFFNEILHDFDKSKCFIKIKGVSVEELIRFLSLFISFDGAPPFFGLKDIIINKELGIENPKTIEGYFNDNEIDLLVSILRREYKMHPWCYVLIMNNVFNREALFFLKSEERRILKNNFRLTYLHKGILKIFNHYGSEDGRDLIDWRNSKQWVKISKERAVEICPGNRIFNSVEHVAASKNLVVVSFRYSLIAIDYRKGNILAFSKDFASHSLKIFGNIVYYISKRKLIQWDVETDVKTTIETDIEGFWLYYGIPMPSSKDKIHQWGSVEIYKTPGSLRIEGATTEIFPCRNYIIDHDRIFYSNGEEIFLYDLQNLINYKMCQGNKVLNLLN